MIGDDPLCERRLASQRHRARPSAAMIEHQPRRDRQSVGEEGRVDTALEALARVASQRQLLAGQRDMVGIEIGAFDQHVGSRLGHARMLTAHDAADIVDRRVVGDHRHRVVEPIGLAVERDDLLAVLRLPRDQRAGELGAVINVERPAEVDRHEIGDVDQHRDRLLADRLELALHPVGRGAVGHTRHGLREEGGAALRIVDAHVRRRIVARDRLQRGHAIDVCERLERAEAGRREVARDAAHTHAVLPVGRDRHFVERVVEARPRGIAVADRRVLGQLNDAVMVLAQQQLAERAHHAVRFDATDRGDLERHVGPRNPGARAAEDADETRARVGRAAHHLHRPVPRIDRQHLQLVGLRVRRGGQHARDRERTQHVGGVGDILHLQPDARQRLRHRGGVGIGVEMLLEPAQRELHAPTPCASVGTSSAAKP